MSIELLPAKKTGAILSPVQMWTKQIINKNNEATRVVIVIKYLSELIWPVFPRMDFSINSSFFIIP